MRRAWFPRAASAGVLLVVAASIGASSGAAQEGRTHIREGNGHYDRGKFSDAEISYRKALLSPDDPAAAKFNLGDALYRQDRFGEAAGQYEGAAASTDSREVRAQALHNLGNALLKDNRLEESIGAYKEALKINPADEDTRYNLEYAKKLLQKQQQQQQQQQNQQNQQNQQQKDEQKEKKQDQKQDQQQQQEQQQNQQKQPRQPKEQISKADAERILEALRQREQDVKKKLQQKTPVRVNVERDW